jgi:hypothetical protein
MFSHDNETLGFICFWSANPCASPPPWPSIFSNYSFWVRHLVNRDDKQWPLTSQLHGSVSQREQ